MSRFTINERIVVDTERRSIVRDNKTLEVSKKISGRKPWSFLHMLIKSKGRILTYQTLEDSDIWPDDHGSGIDHRSSLKIWTSEFNKAFGERLIKCDRGIGYYIDLSCFDSISSIDNTSSLTNMLEQAINLANLNNTSELCNCGFETFSLYEYLLKSVNKRLWIYGRKNKKLFDRSFESYFSDFSQKINSNELSLKVLFLDPTQSDDILKKAQNKLSFSTAINQCIIDAFEQLSIQHNIPFKNTCRFYENVRNDAIIIVDDIILYKNIHFDRTGTPEHLTNSAFFVAPLSSSVGAYYLKIFEDAWDNSKTIEIRDLYGL